MNLNSTILCGLVGLALSTGAVGQGWPANHWGDTSRQQDDERSDDPPKWLTSLMMRYAVPRAAWAGYAEFVAALDLSESDRQAVHEVYEAHARAVDEIVAEVNDREPGFTANTRAFQWIWSRLDHRLESLIAATLELSEPAWEAEPERETVAIEAANVFRRRVLLGHIEFLNGYTGYHYAGDALDLSIVVEQASAERTTRYSPLRYASIGMIRRNKAEVVTGELHGLLNPADVSEVSNDMVRAREEIERIVTEYVEQLNSLAPSYFRQWRTTSFEYDAALERADAPGMRREFNPLTDDPTAVFDNAAERAIRRLWRRDVQRWQSLYRLNSQTADLIGVLVGESLGEEAQLAWNRRVLTAMFPGIYEYHEEALWPWLDEQPLSSEQRIQIEQLRAEYTKRFEAARARSVQRILHSRSARHPVLDTVRRVRDTSDEGDWNDAPPRSDGIVMITFHLGPVQSALSRDVKQVLGEAYATEEANAAINGLISSGRPTEFIDTEVKR